MKRATGLCAQIGVDMLYLGMSASGSWDGRAGRSITRCMVSRGLSWDLGITTVSSLWVYLLGSLSGRTRDLK